jgi:hypothetical protein
MLLIACLVAPRASEAQAQGDTATLISIEIEPSRPKLEAGEGISIVGTIQNTSQSTVYIRESSLTMTLPVELEGMRSAVYGYAAFFPTEPHEPGKPHDQYFSNVIALKPGDNYAANWTSVRFTKKTEGSTPYVLRQIATQLQYVFFYPGDYKILVTAKYWTDPKLPPDGYRTFTKSAKIAVGAPLFVILIGAALGGLIAYIILPKRRHGGSQEWPEVLGRHSIGVIGAILLSVIITIMLSRIAETQFVISVTVNDVWGAIVIGFFAQYGGMKVLENLLRTKLSDRSDEEAGKKNADQSTPVGEAKASQSAQASAPPHALD